MNELKPCPFCGGEALMRERYTNGIANRKSWGANTEIIIEKLGWY